MSPATLTRPTGASSRWGRWVTPRRPSLLALAVVGVLVLLVYDQAHLVLAHSRHWANEDHTLLWLAARDLGSFRFYQPNLYGQAYFTNFGTIPTEVLRRLGVGLATAGASSSALLAVSSWLVLGAAAWRRGHRLVGLLAVAAPVALSTDSLLAASSAGGRDAGAFLACLGVAILIWSPRSARHVALFAVFAGLGVVWDFSSAFLVAPAAVYALILNWPHRRVLLAGAAGALPAATWLVLTGLFYRSRPDYNWFKKGDYHPDVRLFSTAVTHLSHYLGPAEPELARWWVIPLVAGVALAAVLVATRKAVYVAPAVVAVLGFLYALSTNKITFAVDSVYLWTGRFFLAVPFLLLFLTYLVAESGALRLSPRRSLVAVATLVTLVVATFVVRQATFDDRMVDVVAVSRRDLFAQVTSVDGIEQRCAELVGLARRSGTDLLLFRNEVINPYACNALYYGAIKTVAPSVDRRAWRLNDEERIRRTRVVVVDADRAWCDQVYEKLALACDANTGVPGAVVLHFPAQPVLRLWRQLGEPFRLPPTH